MPCLRGWDTAVLGGLLIACLLMAPKMVLAQTPTDLFSLSLEELSQITVHVATGTAKPLSTAPAVATVITAADIQASGAQTLDDVLESVPGLHVSHGGLGYSSRYFIRGIATGLNPQTLVMVDGIPQTSLWNGDRFPGWEGVPVKLIKRIEIIRGPGSAVYGSDAFAGVINIITKGPADVQQGGQASLSYGSFDTARASLLQGAKWGDAKTAFALTYHSTQGEGFDTLIETPLQLDSGAPLTALPGSLALGRKDADAHFDVDWGYYTLRLTWQQSWDMENGRGLAMALDPLDSQGQRRGTFDLGWKNPDFAQNWELESRLTYMYLNGYDENPGDYFSSSAFGPLSGAVSLAALSEEHARFSLTALYRGWRAHTLRLGTGFFWGEIYDTSDSVNFSVDSNGNMQPPSSTFTQLSDTDAIFQPEARRTNTFAFVQDEWALAEAWELTSGVRFDHYSDFGDTTNPRLALVWKTSPTFTSKLLFGEAFRAPSFAELYAHANVWEQGNPELKPERLRSLETAFTWQPTSAFSWELNLYQFFMSDVILLEDVPNSSNNAAMAQNVGRYRGRGVETEIRYQTNSRLQWLVNFSHQQTIDQATEEDLGRAPASQASFWVRWQFAPNWLLTPQVNWVGRMEPAAGDMEQPLSGYTTVGLALRKRWADGVDVALVGYNLLNAATEDPSRFSPSLDAIGVSSATPQGGRYIGLEGNVHW